MNGIFASGVYTRFGYWLETEYNLSSIWIGVALIGYGLPGFILGPTWGKLADSKGRSVFLPFGLILSAIGALLVFFNFPLWVAILAIVLISVGYDSSQPLLVAFVTTINPKKAGQTMGLNVFLLFVGFGLGSYIFGELIRYGLLKSFLQFGILEIVLGIFALYLFRHEHPKEIMKSHFWNKEEDCDIQ